MTLRPDPDQLRTQADEIEQADLRAAGWAHSYSYGGRWLWQKEISGRTVAVTQDVAMAIERQEVRAAAAQLARDYSDPEDYYPSHEALTDLCALWNEHEALTGGGPGWQERWRRALAVAEELTRREP